MIKVKKFTSWESTEPPQIMPLQKVDHNTNISESAEPLEIKKIVKEESSSGGSQFESVQTV